MAVIDFPPAPSPKEIRAARESAGLTQTEAGAVIYKTLSAWRKWESGERAMDPALFEFFRLKIESRNAANITKELRGFEIDHSPDGWPAIRMKQVSALCNEVDRLRTYLAWISENGPDDAFDLREKAREALSNS